MSYFYWMLIGILVVFVTFGALLYFGPVQLFFGKGEFAPDPFVKAVSVVSLTGAGLLLGLHFATLHKVNNEFEAHGKAQKLEETTPLAPQPAYSDITERQWRISEYERRGFVKEKVLQFSRTTDDGSSEQVLADLLLAPRPKFPEKANLWWQRAALVYANGQVVDIKVAVLYGDEAWQELSTEHVAPKRRGRPTHIENAINKPLIQISLEQSHYAVCFGIASEKSTNPSKLNEEYADDRAANLCRAVANLEFKNPDEVIGISLGVAQSPQSNPDLQKRQRAVVILGVDVFGEHLQLDELVRASGETIRLNGLVINDYTRANGGYSVIRGIKKGEYDGAPEANGSGERDAGYFVLKERSR